MVPAITLNIGKPKKRVNPAETTESAEPIRKDVSLRTFNFAMSDSESEILALAGQPLAL